ncbi:hypothetical protein [Crenothrix sp.]|uniref:hypothetical protein n=1 Tax=Crenothrix sp. TaxID=3100433 RepID=UPI00374CBD35
MSYARLIYEDTPAFIPVPKEMQHHKAKITFLPLDDELAPESFAAQPTAEGQTEAYEAAIKSCPFAPDAFFASLQEIDTENPRSLLELIGKVPSCFKSAAEVDGFIRAERDAWED